MHRECYHPFSTLSLVYEVPSSVYAALFMCHPRMLPACPGSADPKGQYHASWPCGLRELRAEAKPSDAAHLGEFHMCSRSARSLPG